VIGMTIIPWTTSASTETADERPHAALRRKIAWLCHLVRLLALGWAIWTLVANLWVWIDPQKTASMIGHYLNADLGVLSPSQVAWGFALQAVAWIPTGAVAYCIWRLFGTYLQGRIFTGDAAAWVQRVGVSGLIATSISLVIRRVEWLIITSHAELPFNTRLLAEIIVPNDLLRILFSLFVLAIGYVFSATVQIADDNASIV
jgi:hypothetical protein